MGIRMVNLLLAVSGVHSSFIMHIINCCFVCGRFCSSKYCFLLDKCGQQVDIKGIIRDSYLFVFGVD